MIAFMDTLLIGASWYGSFFLRFNFDIPEDSVGLIVRFLPVVILIKVIVFYFFQVYRGMWRYVGLGDIWILIKAISAASLLAVTVLIFIFRFQGYPRSVFIMDYVLTLGLCAGLRLVIRAWFQGPGNGK